MNLLFSAFIISLSFSILILLSSTLHGRFTNDMDINSIQKFHGIPVPRIGGLAILIALIISFLSYGNRETGSFKLFLYLIFSSLPIFIVGSLEDITKKMPAKFRLYISFLSAAMVYFLMDVHFVRIDWKWFDETILSFQVISFIMTLLVIGGTVHAMNLVDGFNGLMLGVSLFMFSALSIVAFSINDHLVLSLSLACIGAIMGLFILNFPFGKIFAGDSGAYLIGFLLGSVVLMLVQRNSKVSAWFPCLLLIYPIFETLFSIYRKVIIRKMTAMAPDGMHLHMLIYKRITRYIPFEKKCINNAMTSPFLWLLSLVGIIPAVFYWENTPLILFFCISFSIIYLIVYWSLFLFKDLIGLSRIIKLIQASKKLIKESL